MSLVLDLKQSNRGRLCAGVFDVPAPVPVITTDPGCEAESHGLEVIGASMALEQGYRWTGPTLMDCGCMLDVVWVDL